MVTRDFSGADVRKVLANAGNFRIDRQRGSHVVMKWEHGRFARSARLPLPALVHSRSREHPEGPEVDQRTVVVPLHDSLAIGTLRDIGKEAGMQDFDEFCRWIDRNR